MRKETLTTQAQRRPYPYPLMAGVPFKGLNTPLNRTRIKQARTHANDNR